MVSTRLAKIFSVLGALGLFGLLAGGLLVALWVHHGFSAREDPSWLETKLARAMRGWAVPRGAKRLVNRVPATPEVLAEARAHWADHCAICHANDGSGETPIGRSLYPKVPDMRAAPSQELSDGELYYIIQNGIRLSGMPAWGETGDHDQESWGLVRFIRHLPKLGPEELEEMKKLNPKSSHELREEREEERFLQGEEPAEADEHGHHH